MSSKDQEILRLQAELARLQAEHLKVEELNRELKEKSKALEEMGKDLEAKNKKLEAAKSTISNLEVEKEKMQGIIDSLQNMMAWFRKKMFGSMSEKNLPLDPSVLEPTTLIRTPPPKNSVTYINSIVAAFFIVSSSMLRPRISVSFFWLKIDFTFANNTATVVVFIPPAVEPGAPPINIRKIVIPTPASDSRL